jgi:hypothetical protein
MRRNTSRFAAAGLAAVLGLLSVPHPAAAQWNPLQVDQPVPPYNPYPPLPLAPPRVPFYRPTYNRRFTEFDAKFKPSSIAIFHRSNLMRKMSVRSLPELGQMADKLKLVSEKT